MYVMGPSGSGKTTLLNLLGGIDRASTGSIEYDLSPESGRRHVVEISKLSDGRLTKFRRKYLSYVFQFYSLIPTLTAKENVALMSELVGLKGEKLKQTTEYWLNAVGLKDRMNSYPGQLSGGERQRVAIARALAKDPEVIFADEPTGQLDHKAGMTVVETLQKISKKSGKTVVMVTHDDSYNSLADRILEMEDGRITGVKNKPKQLTL